MASCRWACLCAGKHTHALYTLLQHLSKPLLAAVQWRLCDCQYCGSSPGASSPHQRWLDYPDVCTPRHLTISQHLHMQPQHSTVLLIWGVWEGECVCEIYCGCVCPTLRPRWGGRKKRNGSSCTLNVKQTNFNPTPRPSSSKEVRHTERDGSPKGAQHSKHTNRAFTSQPVIHSNVKALRTNTLPGIEVR